MAGHVFEGEHGTGLVEFVHGCDRLGPVWSCRCRAAIARLIVLSARMFGLTWCWIVEGGDDVVEVVQDLAVHLGESLLSAASAVTSCSIC